MWVYINVKWRSVSHWYSSIYQKVFPPAGIRLQSLAMTSYSQPIVNCISLLSLSLDSLICSFTCHYKHNFLQYYKERWKRWIKSGAWFLKCDWWWCQWVTRPQAMFRIQFGSTLRNQEFPGYPWASSYTLSSFFFFLCRKSQRSWFLGTARRDQQGEMEFRLLKTWV